MKHKIVVPVAPKPQSRPRFTRQGRAYELKDMTDYKKLVSLHCREQFKREVISNVPISIAMTFYIEPPKSISKVKKNAKKLNDEVWRVSKRPDIDNYIKAILDAMNEVVFKDDGQISGLRAEKVYSLNSRTEIEFEELEN